jgi:hypothetical protein
VLFHHRRLWIYDTKTKANIESEIPHQDDLGAVAFTPKGQVLLANHRKRASQYELPGWRETREWAPTMSLAERIYYYALSPIYTVFPKPGQLDQETLSVHPRREDLKTSRPKLDIWNPIWSNGAFVAVMLLITSLYVQRKDF